MQKLLNVKVEFDEQNQKVVLTIENDTNGEIETTTGKVEDLLEILSDLTKNVSFHIENAITYCSPRVEEIDEYSNY